MDERGKKPTIETVAQRAGVSIATASRALTGNEHIASETRLRVLRAAHELGYRTNTTIGLVIADSSNPFFSLLTTAVVKTARSLNYTVILSVTNENPADEVEAVEALLEKRVEGIIAAPTGAHVDLWRDVVASGVKLVFVDRAVKEMAEVDAVLIDNFDAARRATAHLIALGHTRIGLASGPTTIFTLAERVRGFEAAHREAGISLDPNLVQITARDRGYDAVRRLLDLPERPSALLTTNNRFGEAAMFAIRDSGIQIPDNVSVITFDNEPWTRLVTPKLAVLDQHPYRMGETATRLLIRPTNKKTATRRGKEATSGRRIVLETEWDWRESCAKQSAAQQ